MPYYILLAIVPAAYFFHSYRKNRKKSFANRDFMTLVLALLVVGLTVSVILFPEDAFDASVNGLEIWWKIVFPALLPFFVISHILIGLGVVHMLGVILEPIMRPLFNVPGAGSFVLAMGLASGFPIGALLTTRLREQNLCTGVEAERLLSFTNTADPLFMFGAVAVGMIGHPETGVIIAVAHYLSSVTIGLLMRFYKRGDGSSPPGKTGNGNLFSRSIKALLEAREKDSRPLGQLLSDAIMSSINTLLLVGGFIILFSVIIRILERIGGIALMVAMLANLLEFLGISVQLAPALISGLFEIDLGCKLAGSASAPLKDIVIICGFIIAWSGLSVHAQVASIISKTDIKINSYIICRALHAILAGLYSAILAGPVFPLFAKVAIPAFYQMTPAGTFSFWWERSRFMLYHLLIFLGTLMAMVLIGTLIKKIRIVFLKIKT